MRAVAGFMGSASVEARSAPGQVRLAAPRVRSRTRPQPEGALCEPLLPSHGRPSSRRGCGGRAPTSRTAPPKRTLKPDAEPSTLREPRLHVAERGMAPRWSSGAVRTGLVAIAPTLLPHRVFARPHL